MRLKGVDFDRVDPEAVHAYHSVTVTFEFEAVAGPGDTLQLRKNESGKRLAAFVARNIDVMLRLEIANVDGAV